MVRIGMVGAGWVTQYHLPAWERVRGCQVVAIADPDPEARARRASAHGIGRTHASLEAMLAEGGIDALDIASPRAVHADHVRLGDRAGLPMLCQKPLGRDLAEAAAVVAGLTPGRRLMVHENWRFRPYYRRLHAWLGEGLVGDVLSVRLDVHSSGMIAAADGARPALLRQPFFRFEHRLLVMEVLIHHIDTLRFLLGELDLVDAQLRRSNDDIVGEDSAMIRLRRKADRVPVNLSGNLAVHGAPPIPADQLWIFGSKGTVHLDGTTLRLLGPAAQEEAFDPAQSYQAAYDGAIAHFAEGLVRGDPFETAPVDNLQTLQLVEAAYAGSGF